MKFDRTRRAAGIAALGVACAVGVAACGSSGGGGQVDARGAGGNPGTAAPPSTTAAPTAGNGSDTRTVRYRGLQFDVPADWPVYDLEADPSTCVRFDVHAVYLGHPGADMRCPAVVVGRTDSLLVEPVDGSTAAANGAANASEAGQVNGLAVATDRSAAVEHELHATFANQGVVATITFLSENRADAILGTFKAASK
jgi:hypothetical protein